MDYVAHGCWSYIIFHKIRRPFLAVIFGLLPDTSSWFVYAIYRVISQGGFGKPVLSEVPAWAFILYDISHSIIVAFAVIAVAWLIARRVLIYMLAWPIAIVMDLLTHRRDFLPTPFLWPLSDWRFPGISWGTAWFMALNWGLIIGLLILIRVRSKRAALQVKDAVCDPEQG